MIELIHYTHCPVCGSADLLHRFDVRDHTVSGQSFPIIACLSCTLMVTQDVPGQQSIGAYYKSSEYISHSETAKGLINRIYYKVRKRTLAGKRKLVQRISGKTSGRLLDLGSGTGLFAGEMQRAGWDVTGLEPDSDARAVARAAGVVLDDINTFSHLEPGRFDIITLWHVLEHVHDLTGYMQQLKKLLAPGGKLLIAVPNYTAHDANAYRAHWAAYDVPRHLYHFSPAAMNKLVSLNDMRIVRYLPMWYDSFYISLVSSRYKNGSTNWIGAVWTGFWSNIVALFDRKKCSSVIYVIER